MVKGELLKKDGFVAFALVFPGWPGVIGVLSVMAVYVLAVTTSSTFDTGSSTHYKELAVRLATMATATMMANMIVRIERSVRRHAVRTAPPKRHQDPSYWPADFPERARDRR